MTCERIAFAGGVAIVCSRGQRIKRCGACGSGEAKRLCDFPLRGPKAGKTCSAGLCDGCTRRTGDFDLCPPHARALESRPELLEPPARAQQELDL